MNSTLTEHLEALQGDFDELIRFARNSPTDARNNRYSRTQGLYLKI